MVDWNGRTGYVDLSKSRYRESKSRWQKKKTRRTELKTRTPDPVGFDRIEKAKIITTELERPPREWRKGGPKSETREENLGEERVERKKESKE